MENIRLTLAPFQMSHSAPQGVVHRTRAPVRTAVVVVEQASLKPTGD